MILSSLFHGASYANEGLQIDNIINNLSEIREAKVAIEKAPSFGKNPHLLRIFVSSSMPRSLLKAYALEAKKYNGVLVFKGLPGGSFKAMSDVVQYLNKDQNESALMNEKLGHNQEDNLAIQIDDEVFEKFNITSVPSFVLSEEKECYEAMSCKNLYDKISGNISIKVALEKFTQNGELKAVSAALLKANNQQK